MDSPNVQTAIAAIMAELPAIGKEGKAAPSQGGYAYRGIEQITGHIQPLLAKHGVAIVPQVQSVDVKDIIVAGKPWTDTTLRVDYLVVGPDGSQFVASTVGIGRDNSDKGGNKAMTQAYKYLLLQLFCISDSADDGDGTTHVADARPQPEPMADDAIVRRARAAFERLKAMTSDQKDEMRDFATGEGGLALSMPSLIGDEGWLAKVETKLTEVEG
jgi:hypothetical protein